MWQFSFLVARRNDHKRLGDLRATPGRLAVKLALLPHSPPTRLNATLVISERAEQVTSTADEDNPSGSSPFSPPAPGPSVNPPIEVRLTAHRQLVPATGSHGRDGMIVVSLETNDQANTLQVE